jgi:hypothetical protein
LPATPNRLAAHIAFAKNSLLADRLPAEAKRLQDVNYPVLLRELDEDHREFSDEQTAELARWIDTRDRIELMLAVQSMPSWIAP